MIVRLAVNPLRPFRTSRPIFKAIVLDDRGYDVGRIHEGVGIANPIIKQDGV